MTLIVEIFPQCDFCLETYPDSKHTTIKMARHDMCQGRWPWKRVKGKDMCPDCVASHEKKTS